MTDEAKVDTPGVAWTEMSGYWDLIDTLWGGTQAMRDAGADYLPREPKEKAENYENRLKRSFLYPAFKDCVTKLAAKPFCKQITVQGKLPEPLDRLATDVDREGADISAFGQAHLLDGIGWGLSFILVDHPSLAKRLSLKEARALDVRPYFSHIKGRDMIAVNSERRAGSRVPTRVRFKETRTEYVGKWGEVDVDYIRVFTETEWAVFRKAPDAEEFTRQSNGTHTFGGIPVVPMPIGELVGYWHTLPPLYALAEMNLSYWQAASDHKAAVRFMRSGLWHFAGHSKEEAERICIGPGQVLGATNPLAKATVVEHSGASYTASRQDLIDMKEDMEVLGMQPLLQQAGNPTATGKSIDEAKAHSTMQAWIGLEELALTNAFKMAARWVKTKPPKDLRVVVYKDFGLSVRAVQDVQSLIAMRMAREICRETFLNEVKRRGTLSDMVDVKDEIARIETEGPDLPMSTEPAAPGAKKPAKPVGAAAD